MSRKRMTFLELVRKLGSKVGYENFKKLKHHYIEFDDDEGVYNDFYRWLNFVISFCPRSCF